MLDYSLSKIYKLVSNKSPDIYIGSCTTRLSTRLCNHKSKSNHCVSKKIFVDDATVTIVLIEDYPCENKNMLKARELYHITNNICININKPFVCEIICEDKKAWDKEYKKEYRLVNNDKIKEDMKEYYITNADKIKDYQKEYRTTHKEYNASHKEQRNTRARALYAEKKLAQNLEII